MSRTGYLIKYGNCPIIWCSKLQSIIALSTTENEYIVLSQYLRDGTSLVELLKELESVIPRSKNNPEIHCLIFEDNMGSINLVKRTRMRPRTKHISLKYHHFREYVRRGLVSVNHIDKKKQITEILTKVLTDPQYLKLRNFLTGF